MNENLKNVLKKFDSMTESIDEFINQNKNIPRYLLP